MTKKNSNILQISFYILLTCLIQCTPSVGSRQSGTLVLTEPLEEAEDIEAQRPNPKVLSCVSLEMNTSCAGKTFFVAEKLLYGVTLTTCLGLTIYKAVDAFHTNDDSCQEENISDIVEFSILTTMDVFLVLMGAASFAKSRFE